ncbi:MAG: hypothetical protein ACI4TI_03600 [Christensenellales bacterium]
MEVINTISLILSIAMLSFIVIGVLYGLIVGFKKSLASGIYNLALVVVLILITSSLTTMVLQFDLSSLGLQANGTACKTLGDFFVATMESNPEISNIISTHPEIKDVILTLPSLLASPIIFVVLFWTIKILVFVISLPINLIVKLCSKRKQKPVDERGRVIKPKKRRLLGMACGFVIGLVAVFATMVPIFGVGSAVCKLNEIKTTNSSLVLYAEENSETHSEQSLLEIILGKETSEQIVSAYQGNVAVNISRIIGMEAIGSHAFNTLTKTKINGAEVKLLDDITTLMNIYSDSKQLYDYFNKETLSQSEMANLINQTDKIINEIFEVKILTAVGNTVFPVVVDGIINDPSFPIQLPNEIKNDKIKDYIVKEALFTLQNYDFSFVKNVLLDLTSILRAMNDNGILTPVYNNTKAGQNLTATEFVNLLKNTDANFAQTISQQITNTEFIKDMSPAAVDVAFESLFNAIGKSYSTNNITKTKATALFESIIENTINCVKTLDMESSLFVTKNSFGFVGNILDLIKDPEVLSASQYASLTDFAETKVKELTSSLPIDISAVVQNISDVENWSSELEKISGAFDEIKDLYNSVSSGEINIQTFDLAKAGILFDKLETTTLFKNQIRPIFNDLINLATKSLSDYETAFEILKISESDLQSQGLTKVEWEKELTSLSPLIQEVLKFKDLELSTDKQANAQKIVDLCKKFDDVEQDANSAVYSKKMQPLLTQLMTIAKNQDAENSALYDDIITRLNGRLSNETLTECVEKGAITYALDSVISSITTQYGIKDALTQSKDFIVENNTIEKLFNSMEKIDAEIENLSSISVSDISSVTDETIEQLSNSLNNIKNTGSFPVSFTNTILSNIMQEIDYSTIPDPSIRADIANYISEKQADLASSTFVVTDNTYQEILSGLKDLVPTV